MTASNKYPLNLVRSIYNSQEVPIEAKIIGEIPKWLNGTFYRNGPGRFKFGENTYKHLFDGMSCVNKIKIDNGKVFYTNKLLETNALKESENNLLAMFGTPDLCNTIFDRFKLFFNLNERKRENDNTNVNIVPFAFNQLYALTETNHIIRLNPNDLSIKEHVNLVDYSNLKPTIGAIAHPHVEDDGSWITVGMQPGKTSSYNFMKFPAAKNGENLCENGRLLVKIPSSHTLGLSYIHSFGLSKNYIIFLEQSLKFDLKVFKINQLSNKAFSDALIMQKDWPTQIHLINRHTGELLPQIFYTDPQFSFHHINAFETEDKENPELIVDVCSYSANEFDINNFSYGEELYQHTEDFLRRSKSYASRIRIPLAKLKEADVNKKVYCELKRVESNFRTLELSTINYAKYNTKFYNYTYGLGTVSAPFKLVKVNMNKPNESIEFAIESDNQRILPSEPVFVESPNAKNEDDGVLLSLVLGDKYDFLVVVDAITMKEIGRAVLPDEVKATFTFHGFFADAATYKELN